MALTRAQLLMGNSSQGPVLAGQVQGVKQGAGIVIAADGTITLDSTGVLKTNNPAAYNAYIWPTTLGTAGQVLQLGAAGALSWEAGVGGTVTTVSGTLPITVATGTTTPVIAIDAATQALTGSVRVATTTEATTGTDVATALSPGTGVAKNAATMTGSAFLPAGITSQRPSPTLYTGQFRYNIQTTLLEYSDGVTWLSISNTLPASLTEAQAGTLTTVYSSPETAVPKNASGMSGSAFLPAGTTAQRPSPTLYTGQFRYNIQIPQLEYSDGATWLAVSNAIPASLTQAQTGTLTTVYSSPETAVPKNASGMSGSAFLPAGVTSQRPLPTLYAGQFRYNLQIPQLEYSDGTSWLSVAVSPASLTEAQTGTLTTVYSSPETAVPKNASGMIGSAFLPAGTTAQRPSPTLYAGQFRYNIQISQLEYSDGTSWLSISNPLPASLTEAQTGTLTTVYSSPETAVPKDAAGMTGAAILPGGTVAQRPATSTPGNLRWNSDTNYLETYINSTRGYSSLAYVASFPPAPSDLTFSASQTLFQSLFYCNNLVIDAGVVLTVLTPTFLIYCAGTATINGAIVCERGAFGGTTQVASSGREIAGGIIGFGPGAINQAYSPQLYLTGSGGSSGTATVTLPGAVFTSSGGTGGGAVGIKALRGITLGAAASIGCPGGDAAPTAVSFGTTYISSGGAGGSGGLICLDSGANLTLASGAVLNASGGDGAPSLGSGVTDSAPGGSGGGGGWIILQSLGTTADASTKNVNGGVGGADTYGIAPWAIGATSGAGNGGFGGFPTGLQGSQPGNSGNIANFGSPF